MLNEIIRLFNFHLKKNEYPHLETNKIEKMIEPKKGFKVTQIIYHLPVINSYKL